MMAIGTRERVNPTLLPIKLGAALFSLTEPFEGQAIAYNRWYDRDHFYAGGRNNPYVFAGRRFVATRDLKELRYVADGCPVTPRSDIGSFLHLYWILAGGKEDWFETGRKNFVDLWDNGRMEGSLRETIHTVIPDFSWAKHRDDDGVPAEQALDHPFTALALTTAAAGTPSEFEALDRWYREQHAPDLLKDGSPVALCVCMLPKLMPDVPRLGRTVGDEATLEANRLMLLWFLDEPVSEELWSGTFAGEADSVAATGHGHLECSAPFKPVLAGTDRYVDEL